MRLLLGFHAGVLSPFMAGRGDLAALRNGCAVLKNMIPRGTGGAFQRPGTWWLGQTAVQSGPARLLPFVFSRSQAYVMEFGPQRSRFWLGSSGRLCVTQPLPPPPATTYSYAAGTYGQTISKTWYIPRANYVGDAAWLGWADANPPNAVPAGANPAVAPTVTGATWINSGGFMLGGVEHARTGTVIEGYFKAPTTGIYSFQVAAQNVAFWTLKLSSSVGAGPATMQNVLVPPGNGQQTGTNWPGVLTLNLTANAEYAFRIELLRAASNAGTLQFKVGSGAWQNFTAAQLAPIIATPNTPPLPEVHGRISSNGEPLVLETPYLQGELRSLQMAQANDVVWLAHGNHWPRELIRHGQEDWRIKPMVVKYPPLRDPNSDTDKVISASGITGTGIILTASHATFEAGDIGGYYEIAHRREAPQAELNLNANGTSPDVRVERKWEVFTTGKWTGILKLWKRRATGSGQDIVATWSSRDGDFNVQDNGELDEDSVLFLEYSQTSAATGTIPPRATLTPLDSTVKGLVRITAVASPTSATADVVQKLHSTAPTWQWSEGAWSVRRGFPRAVCLHEQRLWFGGNRAEPQKLWASSLGGFDDFEGTTIEDSAFSFAIAATRANPIQSFVSQPDGLVVFTTGDEWAISGGSNSPTITPSSATARKRSENGSEPVQPLVANGSLIFIESGGRNIAEHVYTQEINGFDAVDLCEVAEHLFGSGILEIAYAPKPHSLLLCVLGDGRLATLTFRRSNQVLAWAEHVFADAKVESVTSIPGADGASEVWFCMERASGRHMERLRFDWNLVCAGQKVNWADGAVEYRGTNMTSFNPPTHLKNGGQFQTSTGENGVYTTQSSGGVVQFPPVDIGQPADLIVVGASVQAQYRMMAAEIPLQTGSSMGKRFRVSDADIRTWASGDFFATDQPGRELQVVKGPESIRKLPFASRFLDETSLEITGDGWTPVNLLSLSISLQVYGP